MPANSAALAVSGLSVERSGKIILQPTTLSIAPRERVAVVGGSGAGKSTLGHALIDALRARAKSVAHVPQSPEEALDPLRSLAFQWREAERALGQQPDVSRQQTLLRALKIDTGDLRQRPWAWSRGMQQRLVIALALIGAPDLLSRALKSQYFVYFQLNHAANRFGRNEFCAFAEFIFSENKHFE